MKLLSLKREGQDRAGMLIGEEVLDVIDYFEIVEAKGEWVESEPQLPGFHHLEGVFRDAMDLYHQGPQWLSSIVSRLEGDPLLADECRKAGALKPLGDVALNPPVLRPGKILAVGLNYAAHARETGTELPDFPLIFSKCTTSLIGPEDAIHLPRISRRIDYEGELAVVIGKRAESVRAEDAFEYVAGYTIMNDVTARDLQGREKQWVRAKGLNTFAPCGPWLVTKDEVPDPHALALELRLNGEVRQSSSTDDLIFKIPRIIEFVSEDLTLMPGDIISTGTPSGVGFTATPPVFLKAGDRVEVTIKRIGTLRNPVTGPEQ
ncbi:MAG TPA: fumarylacetoacetate hydrolase family protein [Blastocatellia bacterium]|nr:fumarylacetoacetate hydrolase family protein [Blastocatellia bacterium]